MEMQMSSGLVLACMADECSWWSNKQCHARQIQVGDMHPTCDTFTRNEVSQTQLDEPPVGQCMVSDCKYNAAGRDCTAPGITVGLHSDHADCETYVPTG